MIDAENLGIDTAQSPAATLEPCVILRLPANIQILSLAIHVESTASLPKLVDPWNRERAHTCWVRETNLPACFHPYLRHIRHSGFNEHHEHWTNRPRYRQQWLNEDHDNAGWRPSFSTRDT